MAVRISRISACIALTGAWLTGWGGCSSVSQGPLPVMPPEPPPYVQVPHPDGTDIADLRQIFYDKSAPKPEALKDCEADFMKLRERTQSKEELEEGARELVRLDPV